ncbi:MAG: pentapeptide repeat-containing protein, partial [Leptolyngbyaceae bacterium]|nr:pentapeptide repeat-containing protein [Leptolyngbyaceae bacterium]
MPRFLMAIHRAKSHRFAAVLSLTVALGTISACTDTNALREQRYSMAYFAETGECPGCNLQGVDFTVMGTPGYNLAGANLRGASFEGMNLSKIDFSGADLRGANLQDAIVTRTDFRGADLRGANVEGANLDNALTEFAQLVGNPGVDDFYRPTPARVMDQLFVWFAVGFGGLFTIFLVPFLIKLNRHLNTSRAKRLYQEGIDYLQNHQYQRAIAQFSQALSLKASLTQAFLNRGRALFMVGQLDRAQADIDQFLTHDSHPQKLEGLVIKGTLYLEQREHQLAVQHFSSTLKHYPQSASAYAGRGIARKYLGDELGGLDDLSQSLEFEPDASAYLERSTVQIVLGHYLEALDDIAKAVTLSDETAQVQYYRGLAQYYLGDRPEALRQWQKVIETDPSTIHPKAPTT